MNDILTALQSRNSAPRLTEPGPDEYTLQQMFASAQRAPDHAWLKPTRLRVVEGEARNALGQVFEAALLKNNPDADESMRSKALNAPLRAPLLIVVSAVVTDHPKVPRDEQVLTAGCAAHSLLLAAEAQGYAGIWRTGAYTSDAHVLQALGMEPTEEIVGFLYFGSRDGAAKPLPERKIEDMVSRWEAPC